jgi:hypothetical protein
MFCVVVLLLRCDDIDIDITRSKFNNWPIIVFTYVFLDNGKKIINTYPLEGVRLP